MINKVKVDEVKNRLNIVTGSDVIESWSDLYRQSRDVLIKIIELSDEIKQEGIVNTYEEYRYGQKPSFMLYYIKN